MTHRICSVIAVALALVTWAARAADVSLTETGSTLLLPLFDIMVPDYLKTHPGVQITTAGTGSGAGQQQALSGQVIIGASDAYMSDREMRNNPNFLDIPVAISAQTVNYNVPGSTRPICGSTDRYCGHLHRYSRDGNYTPAIVALNPGVALPHRPIIRLSRTDGSGDTFVFTQFLTFSTPSWEKGAGFGTTIAWPESASVPGVEGNEAMVRALQSTSYSIGYVGISYSAEIAANKLGTAMLKNEAGQFVMPSRKSIVAGAASLGVRTPPDERLSLIFAPGDQSYPLVNYEYVVVSTKQASPEVAAALRRFLQSVMVPFRGQRRVFGPRRISFTSPTAHLGAQFFTASDQFVRHNEKP